MENKTETGKVKYLWLIYLSLVISGVMLLGDSLEIRAITRVTARLGATILFSAIFLIVGKNHPTGIIATAILWLAFFLTVFM